METSLREMVYLCNPLDVNYKPCEINLAATDKSDDNL